MSLEAGIGDGYCDDHLNTQYCDYDGGDCCGPEVDTTYCSACECLDVNYSYTTTSAPAPALPSVPEGAGKQKMIDSSDDGLHCTKQFETFFYDTWMEFLMKRN